MTRPFIPSSTITRYHLNAVIESLGLYLIYVWINEKAIQAFILLCKVLRGKLLLMEETFGRSDGRWGANCALLTKILPYPSFPHAL